MHAQQLTIHIQPAKILLARRYYTGTTTNLFGPSNKTDKLGHRLTALARVSLSVLLLQ